LLPDSSLRTFLKELAGWRLLPGTVKKLRKRYSFGGFAEAIRFVNSVAGLAETADHHPDIAIHYSRVTLTLWTHARGGLTELDIHLAKGIDALPAARRPA
jgi:4a-hydroxytetrahydrobiopterin dehydratase